jgi:hypothetical protein
MTKKTEKKIILYFTLIYANFLIYNFAFAEFKDWKEEIKPGLDVIERKFGLEEYYIPEWIYEPTFELETTDGANNKQLEEANTEEIKEVAEAVPASSDDMPRWKEEFVSPSSSEELKPVEQEAFSLCEKQGFNKCDELVKVLKCESSLRVHEIVDGDYKNYSINPINESYDRGFAQYSRKWNGHISDECAYSLSCSIEKMIKDYNYTNKQGVKSKWGKWGASKTCWNK